MGKEKEKKCRRSKNKLTESLEMIVTKWSVFKRKVSKFRRRKRKKIKKKKL